jgi:hypothetical protein
MGEYVDIKSSPGEIIGIADGITAKGHDLVAKVGTIRESITDHEGRGETFPSDQFTDSFLTHYHEGVEGVDGATVPANLAVQQSATYCGQKLVQIGESVNKAMTNYEATDDESGDGIARTV